jgi:hypothetical protein
MLACGMSGRLPKAAGCPAGYILKRNKTIRHFLCLTENDWTRSVAVKDPHYRKLSIQFMACHWFLILAQKIHGRAGLFETTF